MDIIGKLKEELKVEKWQIEAAVALIDEGNTIPFISRYRKEATGALNDEVLRNLNERLSYLRNLEEKKEQVQKGLSLLIQECDKPFQDFKKDKYPGMIENFSKKHQEMFQAMEYLYQHSQESDVLLQQMGENYPEMKGYLMRYKSQEMEKADFFDALSL